MLEAIAELDELVSIRTNDLSEPIDLYLKIADKLARGKGHEYKARAGFIRDQCNGYDGRQIFSKYRDKWGIPKFEEDLITVDDFKRGFLFTFRDHTSHWKDSEKAKAWFLNSPEARLVRRYELWSRNSGRPECVTVIEGNYREICKQLTTKS